MSDVSTQTDPRTGRDRRLRWLFVVAGLLVALFLAFFVSRFASSSPDGLNKVAIDEGFSDQEKPHALSDGPLAGYQVRGVDDEGLSTGLAGAAGVVLTFAVGLGLFALLKRRRRGAASSASGP